MCFLDFFKKDNNKGLYEGIKYINNADISKLTETERTLLIRGDKTLKSKNKEFVLSNLTDIISILYEKVDSKYHIYLDGFLYYVIHYNELLGTVVRGKHFWEYELIYDNEKQKKYYNIKLKYDNKVIMDIKATMTLYGRLSEFKSSYSLATKSECIEIKCPKDDDASYLFTRYDIDILNNYSLYDINERILSIEQGFFKGNLTKQRKV